MTPSARSQLWLEYLDSRRSPLTSAGELLHRSLCETAPERYVELLADPASTLSHKRDVLANLLRVPAARGISTARMQEALRSLPGDEWLPVLDILVSRRINSRRARTLVLGLVLGDEQLPRLAATHRLHVARLLRHALGTRTWSAVAGHLAAPTPEGEALLQHKVLRHAVHPQAAREALAFLTGGDATPSDPLLAKRIAARTNLGAGEGLPRQTLFGLRGIYHKDVPPSRVRVLSAVAQTSERRDGPLTALYKDLLLDPQQRDRLDSLPAHVRAAAEMLPELDDHPAASDTLVAIVLDLSASAAASGERAYHPAALGLALARILQARVRHVSLHQVGGSAPQEGDGVPLPQGATDLATAMIAAAREQPRVMLVISDGYENVRPGDAARVAEGLRRLGHESTIYQVVPLFVAREDLAQRRLGPPIVTIPVTHEHDVRELFARILLALGQDAPEADAPEADAPEAEDALIQQLVVAR